MHISSVWLPGVVLMIGGSLAASGFAQTLPDAPGAVDANSAPIAVRPRRVIAAESHLIAERHDLVYARYGDRMLKLDLFQPKQRSSLLPAVVIVHGGGWTSGDKTRFRALAQRLAQRGYATAAIEYRLAGEARFPAAVHDCNAAVRWLRANAKEYGIDPQRVAAVGGSAGGHLVGLMAAAAQVPELQAEGGNPGVSSQLQAAVVMAGPFNLASGPIAEPVRRRLRQSNTLRWLGKSIDEAPELYRLASPLTHLSSSTPPVLFMHGEFDKPEQNAAARARLGELGVATGLRVYHGGKHGCWNRHPWFEPMVNDIDAFLAPILKPQRPAEALRELPADWGTIALHANRLELHVRTIPDDLLVQFPRFHNPIGEVYLRQDGKQLPLVLRAEPNGWSIALPKDLPASGELVAVVETIGQPRLTTLPPIATPDKNGIVTLAAHNAVTQGSMLRYEPQPHKNTVGYWTNAADWCQWRLYVDKPGTYRLLVLQGCGAGQGGSEVVARLGDQRVEFQVEDTGHFQNFKERDLGEIHIAAAGMHALQLRPRTKAAKAIMDVRQMRLVPARQ